MITNAELSEMRAAAEELLPDVGVILSKTYTADGQGGGTITWGTATANVACRIDSVKASEQVSGQAIRPYHSYVLSMPYDTTIQPKNRFVCNGETFNVTSVDKGKGWPILRRAYLERV